MYADLEKYQPENIEYVLDEDVKEKFPLELDFMQFDKVNNVKDAIYMIAEDFNATFPETEIAVRKLDKYEIDNIREEYCTIQEQILPKLMERYQELKQMLKDADDAVKGKALEINRYASESASGVKECPLKGAETFQIALGGYYLTYTFDKSRQTFILAKAFKIPDPTEIWASEEKNRAAMLELFDLDFNK